MRCPYCDYPVIVLPNHIIYGKAYGTGLSYACSRYPVCDAYVGMHGEKASEEQRYLPLGTLANKELRNLRKQTHALIDPYWQVKGIGLSRRRVYQLLAKFLGLSQDQTHIGMFTEEQCRKVIQGWNNFLPDTFRNIFLAGSILPKR